MPEWLWSIIVGGIIIGLIGVIYKGVLTKSEHGEICKNTNKEMVADFKSVLKDEMQGMKDYLDIKVENVIMKELRKLNNK